MSTPINIAALVTEQMQDRTTGYIRKERAVCYGCAPKSLKFWAPVTTTGIFTCHKCKKVF